MDYRSKYRKYKAKYLHLSKSIMIDDKEIVFVRHGQSTENVARVTGEGYDPDNIILTGRGREQANITGEYLKRVYGEFDAVYSSPTKRCIETSEIIMSRLNYDHNSLIKSELLIEAGDRHHKLSGLSKEESENVINGNKELLDLNKVIDSELNPFRKLELSKVYYKDATIYLEVDPDYNQLASNFIKFISGIRASPRTKILVVGHGGTLSGMQKLMCGVSLENDIIKFGLMKNKDIPSYGNCSIMCVKFSQGNFELISPPDDSHIGS
jgi:broad specificity phosphatase PhoE